MTLNDTQIAALRAFKNTKTPIGHKTAESPNLPHHKTIEGLRARLLVSGSKETGYTITDAGKAALAEAEPAAKPKGGRLSA